MTASSGSKVPVTEQNRVRRARERGRYDRAFINETLDRSILGHLGYLDAGVPVVTPTVIWRQGEAVYWHGARATRYMKCSVGADVCLTVTHLDALVLARSAFHHSANYRSVMLFGRSEAVTEPTAKETALKTMIEHLYPGRWDQLRPMTDGEFEGTQVARLGIDSASAKVRTGPPVDDEDDYAQPIWAGVVPLRTSFEAAEADPRNLPSLLAPSHAENIGDRF